LSVVILSLIASLLRTAEQCKAKKVEIRVALLHVPRFPTNYVIRAGDALWRIEDAEEYLSRVKYQEGISSFDLNYAAI
jgi:hypothetical protein